MQIERMEEDGSCTLQIGGNVELASARELFERVLQEDCEKVVLDFTACEVEDRALDQLADLLTQARVNVVVRGLRMRQLRLLEYLGVTTASAAQ